MILSEFLLLANNARMQAEEIRTVADAFNNPEAKRMMYAIADEYDKRADGYNKLGATQRRRSDNGAS